MPEPQEITQQQELLQVHRQTLSLYVQQLALLGKAHVRPGVIHGIIEAQSNIRRVKSILRDWDIKVEDHPDDELPVTQLEIGVPTRKLNPKRQILLALALFIVIT